MNLGKCCISSWTAFFMFVNSLCCCKKKKKIPSCVDYLSNCTSITHEKKSSSRFKSNKKAAVAKKNVYLNTVVLQLTNVARPALNGFNLKH